MIVQGNLTSENLMQTMVNKFIRPEEDINFARTRFYKTWRKFYGYLQKYDIPEHLVKKLRIKHIYPIKFTNDSQIYFFKIHSIYVMGDVSYAKCIVYMRYNDLPTCNERKVYHQAQLLICDKYVKIPAKLLIFYILTTNYRHWEKPLYINDAMQINYCSIEIVTIDQLSLICAYKKRIEMKMPFRRLPADLSSPDIKYLKLINLTENMEIHDFVNTDNRYLAFFNETFNFGDSLLNVRFNSKDNYDREKMQSYINDFETRLVIGQNPKIMKKSSGNSARKQDQQPNNLSVLVCDLNASSTSQSPSDQPSVQITHYDNPQNQIPTDITTSIVHSSIELVSPNNYARPHRHAKIKAEKETRIWEKNEDITEKIEATSEPSTPNLPRRSARNIRKVEENKDTKEVKQNHSNDYPDQKSETYSLDYNFQGVSMGHKNFIKKLLRHYNNPKIFYQDYQKFYDNLNNNLPRIPKMGWVEVDIYKMFRQTIQRGGFHEVTRRLLWKDIYKILNNRTIVTNAATTVKSHYKRLLYDFEQYLFSNKDNQLTASSTKECKNIHSSTENQQNHRYNEDRLNPRNMDNKPEKTHQHGHIPHNDFLIDNILSRGEPKVVRKLAPRSNILTESTIDRSTPTILDHNLHISHRNNNQMHRGCPRHYNYDPYYNHHEYEQRSPLPPALFYDMASRRTPYHPPTSIEFEYINRLSPWIPSQGPMRSPSPHHIYNTSPPHRYSHITPPIHHNSNRRRYRPSRSPRLEHRLPRPTRFEYNPCFPFDYHDFYNDDIRPQTSYIPYPSYYENHHDRRSHRRG